MNKKIYLFSTHILIEFNESCIQLGINWNIFSKYGVKFTKKNLSVLNSLLISLNSRLQAKNVIFKKIFNIGTT